MADTSTSEILVFAQGFIIGQVWLVIIIFVVVKFFIFGEASSPESLRPSHSTSTVVPSLSHKPSGTFQAPLRGAVSTPDILQKTSYDPSSHQPESLGWLNVLVAQTLAQIRLDAMHQGVANRSLQAILNGPLKPSWVGDIKVTEMNLGDGFPIFGNCRIIPVDDSTAAEPFGSFPGGFPASRNRGRKTNHIGDATRLQAQIDVQLNDVITIGVETKLVLNYPKPLVATLPVALAVSVVSFSGTILLSLVPVSSDTPAQTTASSQSNPEGTKSGTTPQPAGFTPGSPNSTALTFTFDPSYTLSLRTSSLVGSRARLTDVPKLAEIIESRIRSWFCDRVVYPRFQQVALPSFWPRMENARGGGTKTDDDEGENADRYDESLSDSHDPRRQSDRPINLSADGLRWRGSPAPVC